MTHQGKENRQKADRLTLSAEGLKGRQSVRATFRLPNRVIDLLGIVAAQLDLKQKSLFDQLLDDKQSLMKIAGGVADHRADRTDHRQKTFVLSKKSLQLLETVAEEKKIPRDVLVEFSIRRLLPIINSEQEKHEKRKIIYRDLKRYLQQGNAIHAKALKLLGDEDQVCEMVKKLVDLCEDNVSALEKIVAKGQRMEKYEDQG